MTLEQMAADFGVHVMTLSKWMRRADIDDGGETRNDQSGEGGTAGDASADQAVGAGERGPAQGRRLPVAGTSAGTRIYPLVREPAADGVPVTVTCRVRKLARQPYYRWLERPVSDAEFEEAERAIALSDAHREEPEFGYRLLADEARNSGSVMADRTAWPPVRNYGSRS
ncbi:hypothetical protein OG698_01820 [Streptomyces sp. NBC_01003]|uniref:hypothetical protein n=1 Tax=Streptomyces sp. NBC_01003 TaxID=2903714 RepID=UPI00386BC83B|nr:hypothetical protein OG698_01820 [Streptomyces sp. NBC_01003]